MKRRRVNEESVSKSTNEGTKNCEFKPVMVGTYDNIRSIGSSHNRHSYELFDSVHLVEDRREDPVGVGIAVGSRGAESVDFVLR